MKNNFFKTSLAGGQRCKSNNKSDVALVLVAILLYFIFIVLNN